jgi:hypothetical protein
MKTHKRFQYRDLCCSVAFCLFSSLYSIVAQSNAPSDRLTYNFKDISVVVDIQFLEDGKSPTGSKAVLTVSVPSSNLSKSEFEKFKSNRNDGLVQLLDFSFESSFESSKDRNNYRATLPSPSAKTLDLYLTERPYSADGPNSLSLASASIPNGLFVFSLPENQTHDRLIVLNIKSLIANPSLPAQEFFIPRVPFNHVRNFSLRSILTDPLWGNGRSPQATLISVADIDLATGRFQTSGAGVLIHQMYFEIDPAFIDFNQNKDALKVHRTTQNGIVRIEDGKSMYLLKRAHSTPHFIPAMVQANGRIDPSALARGPLHPSIIAKISKEGTNGQRGVEYLPIKSLDPRTIQGVLELFDTQFKAELTISRAETLPRIALGHPMTISEIQDAILSKSEVSQETQSTRRVRRLTQEKGLLLLASISSDSPYAVQALQFIAKSELADSTLRSRAGEVLKSLPGDLRGKRASLVSSTSLIEKISSLIRCNYSFKRTD